MTNPTDYDRTPPQDILAEQSVLAAMLLSRRAIEDVEYLQPADFFRPAHETIHATITAMHGRGEPIDPVTVAATLQARGELGTAGGAPYLHTLLTNLPTTSNADYYARIVRDLAIRRRLIEAGTRVTQLGYAADGNNIDEIVETARAEVDAVSHATATATWFADDIDATIDDLKHPAHLVPTPWPDLDAVIGGWAPGRVYVIGARPSVGKSLVAVNIATNLARTAPVALSSLEMSRQEIQHRVMALIAGVPHTHLSEHRLTDDDWSRIAAHQDQLRALRLAIDDRAGATITDVISHARTVARKAGAPLGMVIIDYLQLMTTPARTNRGHENRQTEVAEMSRRLKVAARELACPVVALSQLNRGPEGRADRRPTMADLRESGAIEQDADVVMLLHVDEDDPATLLMAVMKNRHGPTGTVTLHRDGAHSRITGHAWTPTSALERTPR